MVANNLNAALVLILSWEGNDINQSNTEPGGISKYGISLLAYEDYCKAQNLPVPTANTIANLQQTDAQNFYGNYWLPQIRFNDLPSGVDVRLADIAVNLGVTGAINLISMVLQQYPLHNQLSNTDITAINTMNSQEIILALSTGWIAIKHTSPNWNPTIEAPSGFGHGWSNRSIAVTSQCLSLTGSANTNG